MLSRWMRTIRHVAAAADTAKIHRAAIVLLPEVYEYPLISPSLVPFPLPSSGLPQAIPDKRTSGSPRVVGAKLIKNAFDLVLRLRAPVFGNFARSTIVKRGEIYLSDTDSGRRSRLRRDGF